MVDKIKSLVILIIGILFFLLSNPLRFFSIFWLQPILLFQIVVCLLYPSAITLSLIVIGFLCNFMFGGFLSYQKIFVARINILAGYLTKFKDCNYEPYDFQAFIKKNVTIAQKIKNKLGSKYAFHSLEDFSRFTEVFMVKKGATKTVPKQIATYHTYPSSYIFLRSDPSNGDFLTRFVLFHEIGHTLFKSNYLKTTFWIANKAMFVFLFWICFFLEFNRQSIYLLFLLLISVLALSQELLSRRQMVQVSDEIEADNFALECLSENERCQLIDFFHQTRFIQDDSMSKESNFIREKFFFSNYDNMLNKKDVASYDCNPLLDSPPVLLIVVTMIILGLATFAKKPELIHIYVALGVFSVLVVLCFLGLILAFLGTLSIDQAINKLNTPVHKFCSDIIEVLKLLI